ncbi:MAG: ribbon-helix-helix protein, CopG family [Acidobacteriota bacterium]
MAKINISLPDEILKEIDRERERINITRSKFLRRAFEVYLKVLEEERKEEEKKKGISRAIELQEKIQGIVGKVDLVKDLRAWRETRK